MKNSANEANKGSFLTPVEILMIASKVREGKANASEARRLLEMYCYCFDAEIPFPRWLLLHLRDSFRCYLDHKKRGIEFALGLKRKKGRPNASEQVQIQIATDVMRLRLQGVLHQEALEQVAQCRGYSESVIGHAYGTYRLSAVAVLRNERANGFTDTEKAALQHILPEKFRARDRSVDLSWLDGTGSEGEIV
jgi:hypothetical protein